MLEVNSPYLVPKSSSALLCANAELLLALDIVTFLNVFFFFFGIIQRILCQGTDVM